MNKLFLYSAYFFSCLLLFSIAAQASEQINFSGGAPLDTHQPAIIIPILEEAFKRNGYSFKAKAYPSERSLMMSNTGRTDGELHRIYDFHKVSNNKYPNLIRIDEPVITVYRAIFSTQNLDVNGMSDLGGLIIGYQAGRKNFEKELNKLYPSKYIHSFPTDLQAFKVLASGRIDVVVSESFLGKVFINQNAAFRKIKAVWQSEGTEIYSYINIKYKRLGREISQTLKVMKEDGSFIKIKNNTEKFLLHGKGK